MFVLTRNKIHLTAFLMQWLHASPWARSCDTGFTAAWKPRVRKSAMVQLLHASPA